MDVSEHVCMCDQTVFLELQSFDELNCCYSSLPPCPGDPLSLPQEFWSIGNYLSHSVFTRFWTRILRHVRYTLYPLKHFQSYIVFFEVSNAVSWFSVQRNLHILLPLFTFPYLGEYSVKLVLVSNTAAWEEVPTGALMKAKMLTTTTEPRILPVYCCALFWNPSYPGLCQPGLGILSLGLLIIPEIHQSVWWRHHTSLRLNVGVLSDNLALFRELPVHETICPESGISNQ